MLCHPLDVSPPPPRAASQRRTGPRGGSSTHTYPQAEASSSNAPPLPPRRRPSTPFTVPNWVLSAVSVDTLLDEWSSDDEDEDQHQNAAASSSRPPLPSRQRRCRCPSYRFDTAGIHVGPSRPTTAVDCTTVARRDVTGRNNSSSNNNNNNKEPAVASTSTSTSNAPQNVDRKGKGKAREVTTSQSPPPPPAQSRTGLAPIGGPGATVGTWPDSSSDSDLEWDVRAFMVRRQPSGQRDMVARCNRCDCCHRRSRCITSSSSSSSAAASSPWVAARPSSAAPAERTASAPRTRKPSRASDSATLSAFSLPGDDDGLSSGVDDERSDGARGAHAEVGSGKRGAERDEGVMERAPRAAQAEEDEPRPALVSNDAASVSRFTVNSWNDYHRDEAHEAFLRAEVEEYERLGWFWGRIYGWFGYRRS
ncbi:hypothetical protein F4778DRAFT_776622 [Xylariomycetidae sp. FL2044]|nr:hypothetical protein F4778DRAFT_776622 [Xylariomycetidae sp. FL2044]